MNKQILTTLMLIILLISSIASLVLLSNKQTNQKKEVFAEKNEIPKEYWFILHRKSKKELLYQGTPGDLQKSSLVKEFKVNVGIENERPTPLPKLVGREYWNIIAEFETTTDPETAPYFLTLDIPWSDQHPFGPVPYEECDGKQCDWVRPGSFGLHGIANTPTKLTDAGSSGCIRHTDEEITYLYNLLNPTENSPIRYYIEDV